MRLDQLGNDQAQRHAPPRLLLEHFRIDGNVLHLHAARLQIGTRRLHQALRLHLYQCLGQFYRGRVEQGLHRLVLEIGLAALFHFALDIGLDLGAHLGEIAVGHAQ